MADYPDSLTESCAIADSLSASGGVDMSILTPILFYLFNEGSGSTVNEKGGSAASINLTSSSLWSANGVNLAAVSNSYGTISAANNTGLRVSAPFSFSIGFMTGSSATNQDLFHATDTGSNGYYSGFNALINGSGNIEFMYGSNVANGAESRRSFIGDTVLQANTRYQLTIIVRSASGSSTGVEMYLRTCSTDFNSGSAPVKQTLTTSGSGGALAYSDNVSHFGYWSIWDFHSTVTFRYFFLYNEALYQDHVLTDLPAAYLAGVRLNKRAPGSVITALYDPSGSLTGNVLLGIPRYKMVFDPTDNNKRTLYFLCGIGSGGSVASTYKSTNFGDYWSAVASSPSFNDHSNIDIDSSGRLYIGSRVNNTYPGSGFFQQYTGSWQTTVTMNDYTGSDVNSINPPSSMIHAAVWGTDAFCFERLSFDCENITSSNAVYWRHATVGANPSWSSATVLFTPDSHSHGFYTRIGSAIIDDNVAALTFYPRNSYNQIDFWTWTGSAFTQASNPLTTISTDPQCRQFSLVQAGDGNIHCVYWDNPSSGVYGLYHRHRTLDGTWSDPVTVESSGINNTGYSGCPIMVVSEAASDPRVWLFYSIYNGSNYIAYYRSWDGSNWSSRTQVSSSGTNCSNINTVRSIPSGYTFIPVTYSQGVSSLSTIRYITIPFTAYSVGGTTFQDSLADSNAANDSMTPITTYQQDLTDSNTVGDSMTPVVTFPNSQTESNAAGDSMTPIVTFPNSQADSNAAGDSMTPIVTFPNYQTESSAISDSISTAGVQVADLIDSNIVDDILIPITTYHLGQTESSIIGDNISGILVLPSTLLDSVSVADSLSPLVIYSTSISELVQTLDSIGAVLVSAISQTDSLSILDNVDATVNVASQNYPVDWSDSVSALDTITPMINYQATLSEICAITDLLTSLTTYHLTLVDSGSLDDLITAVTRYGMFLNESVTVNDMLTGGMVYDFNLNESITINDLIEVTVGHLVIVLGNIIKVGNEARIIGVPIESKILTLLRG